MKIKIASQCSENWDEMKVGKNARFCDSCDKNVMDFTLMGKEEIISLMLQNHNNHLCGRMPNGLLDFSSEELMQVIDKELAKNTRTNYGFYLMLLGTLTMMSCGNIDSKLPSTNSALPYKNNRTEAVNNIPTPEPPKKTNHAINHSSENCNNEDRGVMTLKGNLSTDIPIGKVEIIGDLNDPNYIHTNAEKLPMFIGGFEALGKFISKNLVYPAWEKEQKIEGRGFVQFTVEKDGMLTNIKVVRVPKDSRNFESEVVRIIRKMPKWKPAENNNKKVRCSYTMPILFTSPK